MKVYTIYFLADQMPKVSVTVRGSSYDSALRSASAILKAQFTEANNAMLQVVEVNIDGTQQL